MDRGGCRRGVVAGPCLRAWSSSRWITPQRSNINETSRKSPPRWTPPPSPRSGHPATSAPLPTSPDPAAASPRRLLPVKPPRTARFASEVLGLETRNTEDGSSKAEQRLKARAAGQDGWRGCRHRRGRAVEVLRQLKVGHELTGSLGSHEEEKGGAGRSGRSGGRLRR